MCNRFSKITSIIFFFSVAVSAQENVERNVVRTANDLKTGNTQDVLTNFMQVGYTDLRNSGKFQFASSIIGLRALQNPSLLIDTNYLKKSNLFFRNFNFNLDVHTDDQNQVNDATVGFKYAIINKRDKTIFNAAKSYYRGAQVQKINERSLKIQARVTEEFLSPEWQKNNRVVLSQGAADSVFSYFAYDSKIKIEDLPESFKRYLQEIMDDSPEFRGVTVDQFQSFRRLMYEELAAEHAKKPLLTVGAFYTFDPRLSIQAQYVQGLTPIGAGMSLEANASAVYNIVDTTVNNVSFERHVFYASAGLNWIILQNGGGQSLIEFKAEAEFFSVVNGLLEDEKPQTFDLSGVLRFRITRNVWYPINFKYDPETGRIKSNMGITVNF